MLVQHVSGAARSLGASISRTLLVLDHVRLPIWKNPCYFEEQVFLMEDFPLCMRTSWIYKKQFLSVVLSQPTSNPSSAMTAELSAVSDPGSEILCPRRLGDVWVCPCGMTLTSAQSPHPCVWKSLSVPNLGTGGVEISAESLLGALFSALVFGIAW